MNIKQEKVTIKTEVKPENDERSNANPSMDDKRMQIDLSKIKTEIDQSGKSNDHLYVISALDIKSLRTEEIQLKSENVNCNTTTTTNTTTTKNKKRKKKQKACLKNVKKCRNTTIPDWNNLENQVLSQTAECSHGIQSNTAVKDQYNLSMHVKKHTAPKNKVPKKSKSQRKKRVASKVLQKALLSDKNPQSNANIPGPTVQAIISPVEVIVIDDTDIDKKPQSTNTSKANDVDNRQPKLNPWTAPANEAVKVPCSKRIVDLNHVMNWALPMQTDHSRVCAQGRVYLSEEHRLGKSLVSRLTFACTKCTQTFVYETDSEGFNSKINKGFVRTTLSIGCGFHTTNKLLRGIGVPPMTHSTFKEFSERLNAMWPIFYAALRNYAPYITLPFAAVVGVIGYNLENWMSDKYTPYNKSIEEQRTERLLKAEKLEAAENVEKLKYKANVLNTNLSPSLS